MNTLLFLQFIIFVISVAAAPVPRSTNSSSTSNSSSTNDSTSNSTGSSSLFPKGQGIAHWTTVQPGGLPATKETFNAQKMLTIAGSGFTTYDGKPGYKAHYPKGSWNPSHEPRGGFSFYASGPKDVDLTKAQEATFGYSIYFPEGFDWVKGGKLPGFYGGDNAEVSVSCSGGRRSTDCFSVRLMWRPKGALEVYTYVPMASLGKEFEANQKICTLKDSTCNDVYGASIERGAATFETGKWNTVAIRVKLNDSGKTDGEIELFFNGQSVINVGGLVIRKGEEGKFQGLFMQTFFGGSTSDWAPKADWDVYFADFSVAVLKNL